MQRLLGTTFVGLSLYSDFLIYSITKKLAVKSLNRNCNQSVRWYCFKWNVDFFGVLKGARHLGFS